MQGNGKIPPMREAINLRFDFIQHAVIYKCLISRHPLTYGVSNGNERVAQRLYGCCCVSLGMPSISLKTTRNVPSERCVSTLCLRALKDPLLSSCLLTPSKVLQFRIPLLEISFHVELFRSSIRQMDICYLAFKMRCMMYEVTAENDSALHCRCFDCPTQRPLPHLLGIPGHTLR